MTKNKLLNIITVVNNEKWYKGEKMDTKKINTNLIKNAETLGAVHTHIHTHTQVVL